jgi:hypothetical protein
MNDLHPLYDFQLGDERRNERAALILQATLEHPGESIPEAAGNRAATDATYHFFKNPLVDPLDLDAAHQRYSTRLSADTQGPLLVAQDTTPVDFTSPARNHTLGQLAHAQHFGFFVHSALAVTAEGLPLGLLHQHVWMRPPEERGKRKQRRHKETADKESQRWLDTEQAVVTALPADRAIVTISDREGDFYDYFALARRPRQDVLIRAKPRRRLAGCKQLLGVAARSGPVQGTLALQVPRKDDQPPRQATLDVRWGTFALKPPSTHPRRKELSPLPLQAILLEEPTPPAGVKPLSWLLLTTLPVTNLEDATRLARWYTYRWRIERYHFVLKSGCQVEKLQLKTAERLRRALALYAIVAARLLHLMYRSRQDPDASCEPVVAREEWEVLWSHFCPREVLPVHPPTLHQVIRWIARLGGFLARKGDGEPGVKVLWRGLRKLHAMVLGFRLGRARPPSEQRSE